MVDTCRRNPYAVVWVIIWVLGGKKWWLFYLQKQKRFKVLHPYSNVSQPLNLSLIQRQILKGEGYFY